MLVPPELQPQKAPRPAKRSACAVTGLPARYSSLQIKRIEMQSPGVVEPSGRLFVRELPPVPVEHCCP